MLLIIIVDVNIMQTECPEVTGSVKIEVKGNSGCSLDITEFDGALGVQKKTCDKNYIDRLKAQIKKQKEAVNFFEALPFVHIPEIWQEHEEKEEGMPISYSAVMEYLYYQDYLDFFLKASLSKLDSVVQNIISIIDLQLSHSDLAIIDSQIVIKKLEDIKTKVAGTLKSELKTSQLDNLIEDAKSTTLLLPIGPTHGDLTLANMMISTDSKRIGIFDFLDSYIESPLLDVAKVRQDTQFHWSKLMTKKFIDDPRYKMVMAYIDQAIDSHYSHYEWYKGYYKLIQGVNIARIFPYEKSSKVTEFTTSAISKLGY